MKPTEAKIAEALASYIDGNRAPWVEATLAENYIALQARLDTAEKELEKAKGQLAVTGGRHCQSCTEMVGCWGIDPGWWKTRAEAATGRFTMSEQGKIFNPDVRIKLGKDDSWQSVAEQFAADAVKLERENARLKAQVKVLEAELVLANGFLREEKEQNDKALGKVEMLDEALSTMISMHNNHWLAVADEIGGCYGGIDGEPGERHSNAEVVVGRIRALKARVKEAEAQVKALREVLDHWSDPLDREGLLLLVKEHRGSESCAAMTVEQFFEARDKALSNTQGEKKGEKPEPIVFPILLDDDIAEMPNKPEPWREGE